MANVGTMARRELGAYFLSPIAYVVLAIFLFSAGLAFGLGVFAVGEEASGVCAADADDAAGERRTAHGDH